MNIHLGFEIGSGRAVEIPLRHLAVTGQTQESGKTTTLEGLISRSGLRAVAFVTKRGESSFHVSNPIPPYFRERTDWPFVASILEATLSEKLKFQRAWIMKLCAPHSGRDGKWKAPKTLADVQANVETALEKARGMNESVYTELREYLKMVVPQIDRLPYSPRLELRPGVNVMDLAPYDFPLQALVVRSVIEWIHRHEKDTISVIPEAWKFAPKQRGSPVRLAAEELIREGGALKNFIWLDSQDIAGVADVLLRQVGVWIFGVQRAVHEIRRTLDHIPANLTARPRAADIATLAKGQFIACWERSMFKVYVQPAWMTGAHAQAIARGEEEVDSAREILRDFDVSHPKAEPPAPARGIVAKAVQAVNGAVNAYFAGAHQESSTGLKPVLPEQRIEEEEAMWKEKYAELKSEHEHLIQAHDALAKEVAQLKRVRTPVPVPVPDREGESAEPESVPGRSRPLDSDGWPAEYEAIFGYVCQRAKESPGILELLVQRPELRVRVERPVLELDGKSPIGRLALLLKEGFFKDPRETRDVVKEAIRRGWCGNKTPDVAYAKPLKKLAEQGFLTIEEDGWHAVPGMKVSISE